MGGNMIGGVNAGQNHGAVNNHNGANLGGQNVNIGNANPMREGSSSIFGKIKDFFLSIGTAIAKLFTPDPDKQIGRATEKMGQAVKAVSNDFATGEVTQMTIDNCVSFMANLRKIDPDNTYMNTKDVLREAVGQMNDDEFKKLANANFGSAIEKLHDMIDDNSKRQDMLLGGMNNVGFFVTEGDVKESRDDFESQKSDVATFLIALSDAVNKRNLSVGF